MQLRHPLQDSCKRNAGDERLSRIPGTQSPCHQLGIAARHVGGSGSAGNSAQPASIVSPGAHALTNRNTTGDIATNH